MNVQDLINCLQQVEDKTIPVVVSVEFGMGCVTQTTRVALNIGTEGVELSGCETGNDMDGLFCIDDEG